MKDRELLSFFYIYKYIYSDVELNVDDYEYIDYTMRVWSSAAIMALKLQWISIKTL